MKENNSSNFEYSINRDDISIFNNYIHNLIPYYIKIPLYIIQIIIIGILFLGLYELIYDINIFFLNIKFYILSTSLVIFSIFTNILNKFIFKKSNFTSTRIGNFTISFNHDRIIRSNELFTSEFKWNSFKYYVKLESYYFLMLSEFEGIIIPTYSLPTNIIVHLDNTIKDCFA
ncbi:YcxB family protein [Leptospira ellinghausenii]|uniref:YcxB family protein n=1 Tax=Leptospira ellinghausenii TaxID=1917822 RepID=UPI000D58D4B3